MVAAALTIVAMTLHPSRAHGVGIVNALVHGGMIALLGAMFVGFAVFAMRRGPANLLILAGLIAYAVSLLAHVGAATINGFIVPALAARPTPPAHDIFLLCWQANQALARLGVVATGAAYAAWSLHLLRDPARIHRILAVTGLVAAVAPVLALASGWLAMDVHGALVIYVIHAAWAVAIGVRLARGGL